MEDSEFAQVLTTTICHVCPLVNTQSSTHVSAVCKRRLVRYMRTSLSLMTRAEAACWDCQRTLEPFEPSPPDMSMCFCDSVKRTGLQTDVWGSSSTFPSLWHGFNDFQWRWKEKEPSAQCGSRSRGSLHVIALDLSIGSSCKNPVLVGYTPQWNYKDRSDPDHV